MFREIRNVWDYVATWFGKLFYADMSRQPEQFDLARHIDSVIDMTGSYTTKKYMVFKDREDYYIYDDNSPSFSICLCSIDEVVWFLELN